MSNPNKHIEEFLEHYFKLSSPPQYAVLLKGKWGVGKTWFLKEIMASLHNPDYRVKTHLYVSLYGIASFEDIENEFFRQLHPVLSSKKMALAGKIGKGLLKTALKIDLNGDGKSDVNVSSQVPDINLPDYLSKTEGLVLVFDDLERASMDLESLLGYINYFVEHQGYKVIIIANEEELFHKEEKAEVSYKRIKEKLIGKTFEIQPRLDLAINNFIGEIESQATQDLFNSNIDLIKDYYRRSAYLNLRHLRQALMDFARLIESLSDEVKGKEGIIEELLSIYLIFSFEIKSGAILPIDIKNFSELHRIDLMSRSSDEEIKEGIKDGFFEKYKEKYPVLNIYNMLLETSIWIDIFDKGLINIEKIEESLRNSHYFLSSERPEWIQLWHFMHLEDNEFDSLLAIVKEQLINKEYEGLGEIKHVTGLFLELVDKNILDITKDDILELAKSNIDSLMNKGIKLSNNIEAFDSFSSSGLEYRNTNDDEFIELSKYITLNSKKQFEDSLPQLANGLLEDVSKDSKAFYRKIAGSDIHETYIYTNIPILNYINLSDFIDALLENDVSARAEVILAISSRYKRSSNLSIYLPEIEWLQEVVLLLKKEAEQREGKVTGLQISALINAYLVPAINSLHQDGSSAEEIKNHE